MDGLQICVRMTDGISFSLSSHCHSNKGLIEGAGAPARKKALGQGGRQEELEREHRGTDRKEAQREGSLSQLQELLSLTGRPASPPPGRLHPPHLSSPDGVPHVETVQWLRAVGAPSRQTDESWQPVRDVDQLVADAPRLLQQRAGDEPDSPDPSFPQRPLPPSQWPVAATGQRLTSVICPTTGEKHCTYT